MAKYMTYRACHINSHRFRVEVADTLLKRARGLMFRKELAENAGMLFSLGREYRPAFWMKWVHFPLDIIWIGKDMKVVDVTHNAAPCTGLVCPHYRPKEKALYALEVPGGTAEKIGAVIGGPVSLEGRDVL